MQIPSFRLISYQLAHISQSFSRSYVRKLEWSTNTIIQIDIQIGQFSVSNIASSSTKNLIKLIEKRDVTTQTFAELTELDLSMAPSIQAIDFNCKINYLDVTLNKIS